MLLYYIFENFFTDNFITKKIRKFFTANFIEKNFKNFLIVNFRLLKIFLLLNSLQNKFENFLQPIFLKKISKIFYRVRLLYCPPPRTQKKFSDGFRRFEFEWPISGQGLKICLALKSRFTRENLRFSKSFQTGQGCLSSRGGNKVNKHGNSQF